jgi:hypothetical protein
MLSGQKTDPAARGRATTAAENENGLIGSSPMTSFQLSATAVPADDRYLKMEITSSSDLGGGPKQ